MIHGRSSQTVRAEAVCRKGGGPEVVAQHRLARPQGQKWIAGVCAGVAAYFGVSVSKVRLGFVLFGLFGAGEIAYIAIWIVAPKAP